MDFQFRIPLKSSDLLNASGNHYYVEKVLDVAEILEMLRKAKSVILTANDPFCIFDHFKTFYSAMENAQACGITNVIRAHDLLYILIDLLGQNLAQILAENELSTEDRLKYMNATKMIYFAAVGTIKAIDTIIAKQKTDAGPKKGKKLTFDCELIDWDPKRYKSLVQLFNVMQLPLERLWDPPVVEDLFVNLLCDVCYSTLELPIIKTKNVCDTAFQILGTAIKRFNHALTFPVRILQIMQYSEISVVPIASGINLLSEEFGITTIFSVLVKDMVDTLSADTADSRTSKHFSMFLCEFGAIAPKLILPHLLNISDDLLGLESYTLRNSVLQIIGEVIITQLTAEDLSDHLKETRDDLLKTLLDHILDVSAHVRSKVLQIWVHIKKENAVPLALQHEVLAKAVKRLNDKGNLVRKNTVLLIKAFLVGNPFAAKLSLEELKELHAKESENLLKIREKMIETNAKVEELNTDWELIEPEIVSIVESVLCESTDTQEQTNEEIERQMQNIVKIICDLLDKKKYSEAIVLLKKVDAFAGNSEARMSLKIEEQCAYYVVLMKSYYCQKSPLPNHEEEFVKQDSFVKFLKDSIVFSEIITDAVPKLLDMLMSKTNSDVFEAVDFFTTAYLFDIKGTEKGMRQMLYLVNSNDKDKRDAVTAAYRRVLFETDLEGRQHSLKVVKNLSNFLEHLTTGHYAAMEILVREWTECNNIDNVIIQVLFERLTFKLDSTTKNESRLALQLLIMVAPAKPSIAIANVNLLETIAFEGPGTKDPRIFVGILQLLMNISKNEINPKIPTSTSSKYHKRYDKSYHLMENTLSLFWKLAFLPHVPNFDQVAAGTFDFIYHLCQAPDIVSQKFLFDFCTKLKEISDKRNKTGESTETEPSTQVGKPIRLPIYLMSRLIFLTGYIAMKEMIFLDIDVYNNLKYRQELKEEKKNLNKKNKRKTLSLDTSASNALKRLSGTLDQAEEELLLGAVTEDAFAELINYICESELLYSPVGMLPMFVGFIQDVLQSPAVYANAQLQQSAILALVRFMSISSKFCEEKMPFVMNILVQTSNIVIKSNIIIGLCDLTLRFPNVIEPWTGHFYAMLHEKNTEVRLTTVKILSHLIMHEMIRVKGQISDLAMCIIDNSEEIRTITEQFFKEIANKSNILYNVLPDIISRLSDTKFNLEEEKYRTIMRFIIGLIQKDRQVESLVEKLCLRFRVTSDERQWRDISFCLSLLSYSEKTIKKLTDNINYFKDKVQIEEVYDAFKLIIANTLKMANAELKNAVTDFELRLEECLAVNENNDPKENNDNKEAKAKGQRNNPRSGRGANQRGRGRRNARDREDSSSQSSDSEPEPLPTPKTTRKLANSKNIIASIVTADSSSEDERPKQKRGRRRN